MNECEHNFVIPVEMETEEDTDISTLKRIKSRMIRLACVKCATTASLTRRTLGGDELWNEENKDSFENNKL